MDIEQIITKLASRKLPKTKKQARGPQIQLLDAGSRRLTLTDLESSPTSTRDGRIAIDEKSASVGFIISTPRRDKVGDIVLPKGCLETLEDYAKNPVVFYAHNQKAPPIAFAKDPEGKLALWVEDDKLVSRAYFHQQTRESEEIFRLVAAGILKAASIGFVPLEADIIPPANIEETLSDGKLLFDFGGFHFKKWTLVEWSVVPVPANPEALRSELENHRIKSPWLRESLKQVAASKKATLFVDHKAQELVYKTAMEDLIAPPQQGTKPVQEPGKTTDVTGREQKEDEQPQAVVFDPMFFQDEGQVKDWLEQNNLQPQEFYAPSEEVSSYVAILFSADQCKQDSVREQQVEQGVHMVFCTRVQKPEQEQKPEDNPQQPEKEPAEEKSMNIAEPQSTVTAEAQQPMEEKPEAEEMQPEKKSRKPYGAEVLEHLCEEFDEVIKYIEESVQVLEQPKVQKFLEKVQGKLAQLHDDTHNFGYSAYPDHFEQGKPKETEEGQDMEDVEETEPSSPEKSALGAFLKEISETKGFSASQKVACQHFAKVFSQFSQEPEEVIPAKEEVKSEENLPSDVEKALAQQLEELSQQLFEMTGKEF